MHDFKPDPATGLDRLCRDLSSPQTLKAAASLSGPPETGGLYSWWITDPTALPTFPLKPRQDGLSLLYVGIAPSRVTSSQTLRSRVLGERIRGNLCNSTFRRSLACGQECPHRKRQHCVQLVRAACSGHASATSTCAKNAASGVRQLMGKWPFLSRRSHFQQACAISG